MEGWFYAEDERSVGPISFDALASALLRMPEPGKTLVWRSGFEAWRPAIDIPELAGRLVRRSAVVATPDPGLDRWSASDTQSQSSWTDDDGLPATATRRRWPLAAAIAVVAAIVAAGVIVALRTGPVSVEPEARIALPAPVEQSKKHPNEQPNKEAVARDPAVVLAELTGKAAQAEAATDAIAQKFWALIEPPGMQAPDYATAKRDELEKYLRELQTAEANVAGARSQYAALLKAERDLIEESARSSGLGEGSRTELLTRIDERQTASLALANRMLQARIDLYRATQAMQEIAIDQFGKYKAAPDGSIRFTNKSAGDRLAAAGEEVNAANKRLDLIEEEMIKARQAPPPPPGWTDQPGLKDMVIK